MNPNLRPPYLRSISLPPDNIRPGEFPYTVPVFARPFRLEFHRPVTMFSGENGSGKSTLLEAIAVQCGFNPEGGNRNHQFGGESGPVPLARAIRLSWMPKVARGFFLRAESFFNFAGHVDREGLQEFYGGVSLHSRSHGEAFLELFQSRLGSRGIFLFDEPEAALSPARQLALLALLEAAARGGESQVVMATHSPILLSLPGAEILDFDGGSIRPCEYEATSARTIMKSFMESPERFHRRLFGGEE